jgi:hypothetical protein
MLAENGWEYLIVTGTCDAYVTCSGRAGTLAADVSFLRCAF